MWNDSQFGLGSHKDRHQHRRRQLGIPFFTRLVNDPTMAKLPMILETKEQTPTTHRDEIAARAGGLNHIGSSAPPAATAPTGPPTNGDIKLFVVMRTSYTTIPQYDFIV